MKKVLISTLTLLSLLLPLAAQGAMGSPQLYELGVKMIDKRVDAITKYDNFLTQTKYISQQIIEATRAELSRVKSDLQGLKAKLNPAEETNILKGQVKSVVIDYRIYQVFLPQAAGIVAADRLEAYFSKLVDLQKALEAKASKLEDLGKDVTEIRNLISEAEEHLSAGHADGINAVTTKFSKMDISDYEGARTLKLEGKSLLLTARDHFSEARKVMKGAVQKIKELTK